MKKEKLRQIYSEVLRGSSSIDSEEYGRLYIKHLSIWDTELLDEKREEYFVRATRRGLPTNEEKLEILVNQDLWEVEKEEKLKKLRAFTSRMEESKRKLVLKSEITLMHREITKSKAQVSEIIREKTQLIGLTAELFADKKLNDYYIYLALYKDRKFEKPLFSEEEFDELTDVEMSKIINLYNIIGDNFAEKNMQRIALSGFFLNNYYLCKDNPFIFYGKPVVDLTYHQADLFSFGRYFKHVLQELKNPPSQEVMSDPDKLMEQYDIQQNKERFEEKNPNKDQTGTASTYVGATKEDMEALGMTPDTAEGQVVDLNEEIRKAGGTLSMEDMIKLHGL